MFLRNSTPQCISCAWHKLFIALAFPGIFKYLLGLASVGCCDKTAVTVSEEYIMPRILLFSVPVPRSPPSLQFRSFPICFETQFSSNQHLLSTALRHRILPPLFPLTTHVYIPRSSPSSKHGDHKAQTLFSTPKCSTDPPFRLPGRLLSDVCHHDQPPPPKIGCLSFNCLSFHLL